MRDGILLLQIIQIVVEGFPEAEPAEEGDGGDEVADGQTAVEGAVVRLDQVKSMVIGMTAPRLKFGTVVATVARMLVPKCSAATVTKMRPVADRKADAGKRGL